MLCPSAERSPNWRWIESADVNRTLESLDRLVAFPTVCAESNLALFDWVQGLLQAADFAVTRILSLRGRKAGLFARIGRELAGSACPHMQMLCPSQGRTGLCRPLNGRGAAHAHGCGIADMKGVFRLGAGDRGKGRQRSAFGVARTGNFL